MRHPFLWFLILSAIAAAVVSLATGSERAIDFSKLWNGLFAPDANPEATLVIGQLRAPRVVLAILCGVNLALAGCLMQALFANPLAEPYVSGVSSGAGLGAVVALSLGLQTDFAGLNGMALGAFIGAIAVAYLVFNLANRDGRVSPTTLLLTGVAIGGICQSFTTWLMLQLGPYHLRSVLDWLMGSLAYTSWTHVQTLAPYSLIGGALALVLGRQLNLLAQGPETAHSLGLSVTQCQRLLLAVATLLAASAVAVCGIVAFVGLLAPHLARAKVGPNHKILLPTAATLGALLLILSDLFCRTIAPGHELRLSVTTGVLGGLYLLRIVAKGGMKGF